MKLFKFYLAVFLAIPGTLCFYWGQSLTMDKDLFNSSLSYKELLFTWIEQLDK